MITDSLTIDPIELERHTGWTIKPEGACKDERCVPLGWATAPGDPVDLRRLANRLSMPLVRDAEFGLWSLGPEAGGRALSSAQAPDLVLPDLNGSPFSLSSLRGTKVLLVAWASW